MLPLLPEAPVLDAQLPEWSEVAPTPVGHALWRSTEATATVRVAQHADALYVAVEVHGDTYVPGTIIAGDHVELWLGDAKIRAQELTLDAEYADLDPDTLGDPAELAAVRAEHRRASDAAPALRHIVVPGEGPAWAELPSASTVPVRSVTRATGDGWISELEVPLSLVPSAASLELRDLALRVDVVYGDGATLQSALVSIASRRDWRAAPTVELGAPVVLVREARGPSWGSRRPRGSCSTVPSSRPNAATTGSGSCRSRVDWRSARSPR